MLVFIPTDVACPTAPPGSAWLSIVRPSTQPGALLIAVHRSETAVCLISVEFLFASAAVQFAKPWQYEFCGPPNAASMNGCEVTLSGFTPLNTICWYICPNAEANVCP